jgi:fatty acid amide hydrolase 2
MNLHTSTIDALSKALHSQSVTPTELLDAHIERIERVNPIVNGMIADRFDAARAEARAASLELLNGRNDAKPLLGIPCTIKEFIGVDGMPQTGGLLWRKDVTADGDATVVKRLRDAGAIIMGSTNIPEGGLWMETYNSIYGRTLNPWNTKRTPGGSSGGEGALVSAGCTPFGIGSDVGGSIRIPAAFCGVVGHKPTGGLVPNTGHFPEGSLGIEGGRFLSVGPLTRSVDDAWAILKIIAGPDGTDPCMKDFELGNPEDVDFSEMVVFPIPTNGRTSVHSDLVAVTEEAALCLEKKGARIDRRTFPKMKKAFEIWSAMLANGTNVPYVDIMGNGTPMNPAWEFLRLITGFGRHTAAGVMMCAADRIAASLPYLTRKYVALGLELQVELEEAMGTNGVLLHPPYNRVAPPHWDAFRTPFAPAHTAIFNVMEFPVTQVPTGFGRKGMPLGMQVVGSRGMDHLTIAAAKEIELQLGGWQISEPKES